MHQIRRIPHEELPRIVDETTFRPRSRTDAELAQLGVHRIGPDLYDVAHVDGTPEPIWGEKLIEGPGRYAGLPPRLAAMVEPVRFAGEK